MKTTILRLTLAIGTLFATLNSHAVVVYTEGADIDNTDIGTLVHEQNLIIGSSQTFKANGKKFTPTVADLDDFQFTLAQSANVTFEFEYTGVALSPQASLFGWDVIIRDLDTPDIVLDPTNFLFPGSPSYNAGTVFLNAGTTYGIVTQALGYSPIIEHGFTTFDYRWTITVEGGLPEPVPAPPVLLLFGIGLLLRFRFKGQSKGWLRRDAI